MNAILKTHKTPNGMKWHYNQYAFNVSSEKTKSHVL